MTLPAHLDVGLKEWASVCHALHRGRQILLLRKGGIHESAGEFEVEHRQFLLFPTFLHQKPEMLKEVDRPGFEPASAEPARITLSAAAAVTDIIQLHSRRQMDAIDDQHVWTAPLIDMRFDYRPEKPIYLLLVRAFELDRPMDIENTPAYAGCKSWVPLDRAVSTTDAKPVMTDDAYRQKREAIRIAVGI